jgi:hypothetical protein
MWRPPKLQNGVRGMIPIRTIAASTHSSSVAPRSVATVGHIARATSGGVAKTLSQAVTEIVEVWLRAFMTSVRATGEPSMLGQFQNRYPRVFAPVPTSRGRASLEGSWVDDVKGGSYRADQRRDAALKARRLLFEWHYEHRR